MTPFLAKTPAQVGSILRGIRAQRGLTQQQLAERLGLPQKAISIAETHAERMPLSRLFQLLGALEVELMLADGRRNRSRARVEW